jgi:hypothetical protein
MQITTYKCDICKKVSYSDDLEDFLEDEQSMCYLEAEFRFKISFKHIRIPNMYEHICKDCYRKAYKKYILALAQSLKEGD